MNNINYYGNYITKLIEEFSSLPGIGKKSAQRIAFHIINIPKEKAYNFSNTIKEAVDNTKYCSICCNLTDNNICFICENSKRNHNIIMVVENPKDMAAYEKTKEFNGVYHILNGAISPIIGIGPSDIKIKELLLRIQNNPNLEEIILATNPNVEGEATAMYIAKLIKPLGIKVTRIANGVPVGGDLEYVDEITLSRALEGRREI